jgi:hypothetical protein
VETRHKMASAIATSAMTAAGATQPVRGAATLDNATTVAPIATKAIAISRAPRCTSAASPRGWMLAQFDPLFR